MSLIVSGVAAVGSLAAVAITYRLGRERFNHERDLADRDAVRRVLDDAASALVQATRAITEVGYDLEGLEAEDSDPLGDGFTAASAVLGELDALTGRLKIRFGSDHDLVTIYESASELALRVAYELAVIREADDPHKAALKKRNRIDKLIRQFSLASDSFLLTAYRVAGVKLPAVQFSDL